MHLPKLPTIFVKGGEERKAYFTVQARELIAAGWVEKVEEKPAEKVKAQKEAAPKPEVKAEAKPRISRPKSEEKKEEDGE